MGGRAILFGGFANPPQQIEEEWNRWYESTHVPSRLALPGFLAARRFKAYEGECKYVSLYELESAAALSTAEYQAVKRREEAYPADSLEVRTRALPGFVRGVYEQIHPDTAYAMPDTDVLFVVAHDVPAERVDAFTAWYNTEHVPAMLRLPGWITARRFRLAVPARQGTTAPQFLSLYDLADPDAVENERFLRERESPWSTWVRSWYTRRLRIKARQISRAFAPSTK